MLKIIKILIFIALCLFNTAFFSSPSFALIEAVSQGRGETEEQAVNNAVKSAVRKNMGALLSSMTSVNNRSAPHLQDRIIQFSRGSVKKTEILEKKQDGKFILVKVKILIDPQSVHDTVRNILNGNDTGVTLTQNTTPILDMGQDRIYTFFHLLDFRKFLKVNIDESKIDTRKGVLSLAVRVSFNDEYFQNSFAKSLAAMLDTVFKPDKLNAEIEQEYKSASDKRAAAFFLMNKNLSFRGWTLPKAFLESMMRGGNFNFFEDFERIEKFEGIEKFEKASLQTHRRGWLHVILRDFSGAERGRIPVPLSLSNVLFFSSYSRESANPWVSGGFEEQAGRFSHSIFCAPYFGIASNRGYIYLKESVQRFELRLSQSALALVKGVDVLLELER